jgi:hypothetical protein
MCLLVGDHRQGRVRQGKNSLGCFWYSVSSLKVRLSCLSRRAIFVIDQKLSDRQLFLSFCLTHSKISVTRNTLAVELEVGKRIQSVQIKGKGWHSPHFSPSSSTSESSCHECQRQRITLFSSQSSPLAREEPLLLSSNLPERVHPLSPVLLIRNFSDRGVRRRSRAAGPESAVLRREFYHSLGPRGLQERK